MIFSLLTKTITSGEIIKIKLRRKHSEISYIFFKIIFLIIYIRLDIHILESEDGYKSDCKTNIL